METQRMPTLFIGHGSPMNALEINSHTSAWRAMGESLPTPRAILAVSAHWYMDGTAVTAMEQSRTIHDFYGFPPELFAQNYPAPGSPDVAQRVQQVLQPLPVLADQQWGLDHGTWSVLLHLYPQAQIPVVQLSIDAREPPAFHYALGQRLAALRDEGVLILGSGNVVHNLRRIDWSTRGGGPSWATEFNDYIRSALMRNDHQAAIDYEVAGDAARLSVPTPEHYLPLLYVLGAAGAGSQVSFPTDGIELGSISMLTALCS
ncbi:4,5-DOPA dioxygenase extradiol [Povalibacter sp.]|uniref:4,5-DOPA-extradiol-dioxygenase n=1 Tax=Povalibacter sp. TaxID=1962978 RepID=UPI002F3F91E2